MDFVQLTHAQRRTFDADGFLAVPQAIKAETVTRLTRACDRLAEAFISDPAETQIQLRRGIVQEEAFDALVANAATVSLVVPPLGLADLQETPGSTRHASRAQLASRYWYC